MTWEELYSTYEEWDEDVLADRIAALENAGPADEIMDVVSSCANEEIADTLIGKCISLGGRLSFEDLLEFDGFASEETIGRMTESSMKNGEELSPDLMFAFEDLVSSPVLKKMMVYALNRREPFSADQIADLAGYIPKRLLGRAALETDEEFSEEEMMELRDIIDGDSWEELAKSRFPGKNFEEEDDDEEPYKGRHSSVGRVVISETVPRL